MKSAVQQATEVQRLFSTAENAGHGPGVSVVIVSHNSSAELGPCIESLTRVRGVGEIIVVDNASSDASIALAREVGGDRIRVIASAVNTGFAGGCNRGFEQVSDDAEMIAFMNPDVRVEEECFERCAAVFRADPRCGCVAPLLLRPDRRTVDSAGQVLGRWFLEVQDRGYEEPLNPLWEEPRRVLAACGALAVFRRRALESVAEEWGPWAEHFFCFWEDLEIGWRLNNAGWRVHYDAGARAEHGRGAGASPGSGPLRWRRRPQLEACIVTNKWMTLIRHLHALDLVSRTPLLLIRDLALVGAGVVRRPSLARYVLARMPLVMRELRRRGAQRRVRLRDISW